MVCFGFGMRIVGPEDVKQQYKEYLQSVQEGEPKLLPCDGENAGNFTADRKMQQY